MLDRSPEAWINAESIPHIRATREELQVFKKVVVVDKVTWAINSFLPNKLPGPDDIYPIKLQRGIDLIASKICLISRASLGLGYIPRT